MNDENKQVVEYDDPKEAEARELAALQAATRHPVSWMDMDPTQLSNAIQNRLDNRHALMRYVWDELVEGIDFGRIHVVKNCPNKKSGCKDPTHFSKPSLWKAGAEKICGILNLRAEWPELVDALANLRDGSKIIALRCLLHDQSGLLVSEGAGARSIDSDYGDPNKALKMAKKSSLIDAVLNAAGLSEVFTQDEVPEGVTEPDGGLDDTGQKYLLDHATKLFGDKATTVLESLARRRFHYSDGDWRKIPAYRLQDAIRSLDEKASDDE